MRDLSTQLQVYYTHAGPITHQPCKTQRLNWKIHESVNKPGVVGYLLVQALVPQSKYYQQH